MRTAPTEFSQCPPRSIHLSRPKSQSGEQHPAHQRQQPTESDQSVSGSARHPRHLQANALLNSAGYEEATEFIELANARKLNTNEYRFDPQLGFITLNQALNQDEVLAVAFQYTMNGRIYQVGEFSNDGVNAPQTLVTKMLKSAILNVKTPVWDLMMKNVYSLNAYQLNQEDFRLHVLYMNDETGVPIPFLPKGNPNDQLLIRVMDVDKLNNNNDPVPGGDGFFDFIPNRTIFPQNGRIIFPVLEPFGSNLTNKLTDPQDRERYVFQELYDSTRFKAQNQTQLNKSRCAGNTSRRAEARSRWAPTTFRREVSASPLAGPC